jgi:uncharacterized membrane protein
MGDPSHSGLPGLPGSGPPSHTPNRLADSTPRSPAARLDVVDWLRGLAVVLMIQTHLYDAWVSPAAKLSDSYQWTRFLGGIPSRLFLLLVGVSMALRFESSLARHITARGKLIRSVQKRGLEILLLAYAFRVQEYLLGHMRQAVVDFPVYWHDLFRIDILNCIAMSMLLVPYVAAPIRGRPAYLVTVATALAVIALGPIVGPAHFPTWIPFWLSSYVGGQRPDSWFPIFPWAAWPLVGVALGHLWVRASRDRRRQWWAFAATGVAGFLLIQAVRAVRAIDPQIIRYPSELVQQMGPGSFFYRLGMNGVIALLGWIVVRFLGNRFSILRQFGRTSLLVYWIHIDLCYGLIAHKLGLYGRLSMRGATLGLAVMVMLMLGVSLAKTAWWIPWRKRKRDLARRTRDSGPELGRGGRETAG